jgi:tRNA A-37 threonylcarbamoyl transferase component Bud32
MLDPERWRRLEELYEAALPLSPDERRALLARESDDALRREAESLLKARDVRDDFLQGGAFELGLRMLAGDGEMNQREPGPRFEANLDPERVIDGRYVILEGLDAGGMGEVYKAKDLKFPGRPVVVKVLKRVSKENPWKLKKFRREGEAQSRVRHENVAVVFDSGTLPGGEPYLVVEFVEGRTLSGLINEHKAQDRQMELPLVAEIMRQTCAGVAAIHRANLVHRDLKPSNIMVREAGAADETPVSIKIIDFGIARDLEKSTEAGQSVGTLSYMPPEQVKGAEVTAASDVFSLGVLAYQLLTNNLPFNAKTHVQLDAAQSAGVRVKPGSLRAELPPAADAAILKALAYDPARRHQSVREFRDELLDALADEVTASAQTRKGVADGGEVKSQRALWMAVAAALSLAVAATVGGLWWARGGGSGPTRAQKVAALLEQDGPQAPYDKEPGYPVGSPAEGTAYALVGFNVWRVRPATPRDATDAEAARETVEAGESVAERIDDGDYLRVGDRFRLSIESLTENFLPDRGGYLYVINREQYADGSFGRAWLLFPNVATFNGQNLIKTDQPVELPRSRAPYYQIKRGTDRPDYVAETYTIIISPWKFWLPPLGEGRTEIPRQLFEEWDRQFGGRAPRASLRGGVGKLRTRREQRVGTRETVEADDPLTPSDPLPQTVLRAVVKNGSPAMVTVALKIRD